MFCLEGQLEDPLRSGWQLVFVDRENDVLLLGDDPWPEFVNSVWCIKILSPQEVHKSGSFGRSLDITKFSSYNELRSELAQMFCLEGQLEDPLRSGWQLVFVDRENDVLLLGDDPWP
ncbi:unnamed protein product [Ilex paraguariensis]|uniref:PB1 domain-containing protein n=1 Tax=Ilex paraguariensis TaxID=185542 RepID=A0ABC8S477_9AQUA